MDDIGVQPWSGALAHPWWWSGDVQQGRLSASVSLQFVSLVEFFLHEGTFWLRSGSDDASTSYVICI